MRKLASLRAVASALALLGLASTAAAEAAPALLDRSRDRICLRAEIAARGGRHGEVRLVDRGGARVVQTLLHTRLLSRAVGEIRAREREGWPEREPGHESSVRYVAALERAERAIPRPRSQGPAPVGDRRRALLIEFILSAGDHAVALFAPVVVDEERGLAIGEVRLLEALDLSRDFVREDMRRIAAEHFPGLGPAALDPKEGAYGAC